MISPENMDEFLK